MEGVLMFTHSLPCPECTKYKNGRSTCVFLCSLTESNHILILAVSPLHFSQSHKIVFDFKTILSSETSITTL